MRRQTSITESNQTLANYQHIPDNLQCRICLQPCPYLESPFCDCRGNLRSIHEQCLLEWSRRVQRFVDKDNNMYFTCELCKSRVFLELENSCQMRSCQKCCNRSNFSDAQFASLITTIIVGAVVMIICLLLIYSGNTDDFVKMLAIFGGCIGLGAIVILVFKAMWECKEVIVGVRRRSDMAWVSSIANSFQITEM